MVEDDYTEPTSGMEPAPQTAPDPYAAEMDTIRQRWRQAPTQAAQPQPDPQVGTSDLARQLEEDGFFDQLSGRRSAEADNERQTAIELSQGWSPTNAFGAVRNFFSNDRAPVPDSSRPRTVREWMQLTPQQRWDQFQSVGRLTPEEQQEAARQELETRQWTAPLFRQSVENLPEAPPSRLTGVGGGVITLGRRLLESVAGRQEQALARAQAMVRGEAQLPQYAEWRSLTETGGRTIADMFSTLPLQYAGIIGGYGMGALEGRAGFVDNRLYKFGQEVEHAVQQAFPNDPARQFEFSHTLVQGLASTLAFGGQGAIAHLLGAGAKGQLALITLSGMAAQTPGEFARVTQALERGDATERDRIIVTLANSALGATEALPFAQTIAGNARGIAGRLARGGEQAFEETVQEATQQSGQNLARRFTYDPNQDPYEGVAESMVVAAISGLGYGTAFSSGRGAAQIPPQSAAEPRVQEARARTGTQKPETAAPQPAAPAAPPEAAEPTAPAPAAPEAAQPQAETFGFDLPVQSAPAAPPEAVQPQEAAPAPTGAPEAGTAPAAAPAAAEPASTEPTALPQTSTEPEGVLREAIDRILADRPDEIAAAQQMAERFASPDAQVRAADLDRVVNESLPQWREQFEAALRERGWGEDDVARLVNDSVQIIGAGLQNAGTSTIEALRRYAYEEGQRATVETQGSREQAPVVGQGAQPTGAAAPAQPAGAQRTGAATAGTGTAGAGPGTQAATQPTGGAERGVRDGGTERAVRDRGVESPRTTPSSFWSYKAPPTPSLEDAIALGGISPDTTWPQWESLSPGMRREIVRSAQRRAAEPTDAQREQLRSIIASRFPLNWGTIQKRIGATPEQIEALRQEALNEGLLRQDRNGAYRRVPQAVQATQPELTISPEERVEGAIRALGKQVSPAVRTYAVELLSRLGSPSFMATLERAKGDEGLTPADARDLAAIAGTPVGSRAGKAASFSSIEKRHKDHAAFLEKQAAEPSVGVELASFASANSDGQSQRAELDALGYYSKALEAAKAWPQKKGEPQQLLKYLTEKAGVKRNEVEATKLRAFLEGKKSVTRDEVVSYLREHRVEVRESNYGGPTAPSKETSELLMDEDIVEMGLDPSARPARWSQNSLDPSNPTYRETVLHLPEEETNPHGRELVAEYDRLDDEAIEISARIGRDAVNDTRWQAIEARRRDIREELKRSTFASGHFPEPNAVADIMSSLQVDKDGETTFVPSQIQSDWSQTIRDRTRDAVAKSLFDPEKAETKARIAELQEKLEAANKEREAFLSGEPLTWLRRIEGSLGGETIDADISADRVAALLGQISGPYRPYGIDPGDRTKAGTFLADPRNTAPNAISQAIAALQVRDKRFRDIPKDLQAEVSKAISEARAKGEVPAGARDERKIAELKKQRDEAIAALDKQSDATKASLKASGVYKGPGYASSAKYHRAIDGKTYVVDDTDAASKAAFDRANLLAAEVRTAEAATPSHPLVNTTDQWLTTTLRYVVRQAIASGAKSISIPSGDTVLTYNPQGSEEGNADFYDNIVPLTLRKILQGIDKSITPHKVDTVGSPVDGRQLGKGFTVFPITDKVRERVAAEGMALFALSTARSRLGPDEGGDAPTLRYLKPDERLPGKATEPARGDVVMVIERGGKPIGHVDFDLVSTAAPGEDGDTAYIQYFNVLPGERLSMRDIRALREEFRREHPTVTRFEGFRVSGARGQQTSYDKSWQTVVMAALNDADAWTGDYTNSFAARFPDAVAAIERQFLRMLPSDVGVRLVDRLAVYGRPAYEVVSPPHSSAAQGFGFRWVLSVGLADGPAMAKLKGFHGVAAHVLHGYGKGGLYTNEEWQILVERAIKTGIRKEMEADKVLGSDQSLWDAYKEAYAQFGVAWQRNALEEELVAKLAEKWASGTSYGKKVDSLLERIAKFFDAIRNALRGLGFQTAEDVFQRVVSGEVANRAEGGRREPTFDPFPRVPSPERAHLASEEGQEALDILLPAFSFRNLLASRLMQNASGVASAIASDAPNYIYDSPRVLATQVAGTVAAQYAEPIKSAAAKAAEQFSARTFPSFSSERPAPESRPFSLPGFQDGSVTEKVKETGERLRTYSVGAPETIVSAATKFGDDIFAAPVHGTDDWNAATAKFGNERIDEMFKANQVVPGFMTNIGRFVSRTEAENIVKAQRPDFVSVGRRRRGAPGMHSDDLPVAASVGTPSSSFILSEQPDGSWELTFFKAEDASRVAETVAAIEADIGKPISPKGWLTPQGYSYWLSVAPDKVKFHVNAGELFGGMIASPRAVEFAEAVLAEASARGQSAEMIGRFATTPDGKMIGYRVVNLDDRGRLVSQADGHGEWGEPGEQRQALATYEFDRADILQGSPDDVETELSIRRGRLSALREIRSAEDAQRLRNAETAPPQNRGSLSLEATESARAHLSLLKSSIPQEAFTEARREERYSFASEPQLDMSPEARKARAEAMGFTVRAYRGLNHPYDPAAAAGRYWQMFARDPEVASGYATSDAGANVAPVLLRLGKNLEVDAGGRAFDRIPGTGIPYQTKLDLGMSMDPVYAVSEIARFARRGGYDSVTVKNVVDNIHMMDRQTTTVDVVFDPSNIRSVNAAFDPAQEGSTILLASFAGGGRPPPRTTPMLPETQASEQVRGLADIIADLKSTLGMTTTQGLYGMRVRDRAGNRSWGFRAPSGTRSQYDPTAGVARVRIATDIDAIAREGGRHIERVFGAPMQAFMNTHAEELAVPAAPDTPLPPVTNAGFSGIDLDADTQRVLIEAGEAMSQWQAARTYENAARAAIASRTLERRLGRTIGQALVADITGAAPLSATPVPVDPAGVATYVQQRYSVTGSPTPRVATAVAQPELSTAFADFFRRYITDPDGAKRDMPGVYTAFEEFLDANDPAMLQDLERIQLQVLSADYKAYQLATAVERGTADVATMQPDGLGERLADWYQTGRTWGGRWDLFKQWLSWVGSSLSYEMTDRTNPILKTQQALLRVADANGIRDSEGRPISLQPSENAARIARMQSGADKIGHQMITHGVPDYQGLEPVGPSLHDALVLAFGGTRAFQWNDKAIKRFGLYLEARRAVAEWPRFVAGEISQPTRRDLAENQQIIAELEAANPNYARAAQMVYDWQHRLLTLEYMAGKWTQEAYNELTKRKDFYVPFMRDLSDLVPMAGAPPGSRLATRFTADKKFKGSQRDIINPIESMIKRAHEVAAAVQFNDMVKALTNLSERAGPGGAGFIERVQKEEVLAANKRTFQRIKDEAIRLGVDPADAHMIVQQMELNFTDTNVQVLWDPDNMGPARPPIVPLWENGERKLVRLNDPVMGRRLFDAMNALGREQANLWIRAIGYPASVLRAGVTMHPAFVISNVLADMQAAWALTGAPPVITQAKGLAYLLATNPTVNAIMRSVGITPPKLADLYSRVGGIAGGMNTAAINAVSRDYDLHSLRQKGFSVTSLPALGGALAVGVGAAAGGVVAGPVGATLGASVGAMAARLALGEGAERFFARISEASETATRLGVAAHAAKRARKLYPNMSDIDVIREAAFTARDVIDFDRAGARAGTLLKLIPFLNSALQGTSKAYRQSLLMDGDRGRVNMEKVRLFLRWQLTGGGNFRQQVSARDQQAIRDGARLWVNMMILAAVATAISFLFSDDPEYDDVRKEVRNTHYVFKLWGTWYRIKKPFELANFANIGEAFYDWMAENDPRLMSRIWSSFRDTHTPPFMPQSYNLMTGWITGVDAGRPGSREPRPIVPDGLSRLPPSEQYNAYTSAFALAWSRALQEVGVNVSPMMIDWTLNNELAYWGREIRVTSDYFFSERAPQWTDTPIIGTMLNRFTHDPSRSSESIQEFWALMGRGKGEFDEAYAGYDALLKRGNQNAVMAYLAGLSQEERVYAVLQRHFRGNDQAAHPLNRANIIYRVNSGMRREMAEPGGLINTEPGSRGESIPLAPTQRAQIDNILGRLSALEAWNALHLVGRPGWGERDVRDPQPVLDELRAASEDAYREMMRRRQHSDTVGLRGRVGDFEADVARWREVEGRVNQMIEDENLLGTAWQRTFRNRKAPTRQMEMVQ